MSLDMKKITIEKLRDEFRKPEQGVQYAKDILQYRMQDRVKLIRTLLNNDYWFTENTIFNVDAMYHEINDSYDNACINLNNVRTREQMLTFLNDHAWLDKPIPNLLQNALFIHDTKHEDVFQSWWLEIGRAAFDHWINLHKDNDTE